MFKYLHAWVSQADILVVIRDSKCILKKGNISQRILNDLDESFRIHSISSGYILMYHGNNRRMQVVGYGKVAEIQQTLLNVVNL